MYYQNYNPMGNEFLSTIVAAVPILVLLYFIALHPHKDKMGTRHLGIDGCVSLLAGDLIRISGYHLDCPGGHVPLHHDRHHRPV